MPAAVLPPVPLEQHQALAAQPAVGLVPVVGPAGLVPVELAPVVRVLAEQAPVVQLAPVQLPAVRRLVPQRVWPAALPGWVLAPWLPLRQPSPQ